MNRPTRKQMQRVTLAGIIEILVATVLAVTTDLGAAAYPIVIVAALPLDLRLTNPSLFRGTHRDARPGANA